jgi:hypothetical protein
MISHAILLVHTYPQAQNVTKFASKRIQNFVIEFKWKKESKIVNKMKSPEKYV